MSARPFWLDAEDGDVLLGDMLNGFLIAGVETDGDPVCALLLHLDDGRKVLIGTDRPEAILMFQELGIGTA